MNGIKLAWRILRGRPVIYGATFRGGIDVASGDVAFVNNRII